MIQRLQERILEEVNELRKSNKRPEEKLKDLEVLYNTKKFLEDYDNAIKILQKDQDKGIRIFDIER